MSMNSTSHLRTAIFTLVFVLFLPPGLTAQGLDYVKAHYTSWFPLVDRNAQTIVDIARAKESDFQTATQRVYRSKDMPSRLVAQMLP